jgi:bifunctional UDP-N-acetylglucosamine pyrophosphorylase / glucosamine-1-phosphate N-acetyltransferase
MTKTAKIITATESGFTPMPHRDLAILILAAGKGTRMKSAVPKVLHPIAGLPMINHVVRTAQSLKPKHIITVIAPEMDEVAAAVSPHRTALQKQQKGTADAVKAGLDVLGDFAGDILVLYADVPLVTGETLNDLIAHHQKGKFGATVLAMAPPNPTGYGRIFQNQDGTLNRIVEEKDATEDEKVIRLCNSGLMVLRGEDLSTHLNQIKNKNAQGEYYLVDLPKILADKNIPTGVIRGDYYELRGVNSRTQLAELEQAFQHRMRLKMMDDGVTLLDPNTVYFHYDTQLAPDCVIHPNVVFGAKVTTESRVTILPFCVLEGVHIKADSSIGPFARIRPNTIIHEHVKIGNFVEIKNAILHHDVKASHLSYIGDAEIGAFSNFGCGAITVNYDGINKHKTIIGDHVMVGSNASLIAPITLENGAYVAAGSTITDDVPADTLAIGRAFQVNKPNKAIGRMKQKN